MAGNAGGGAVGNWRAPEGRRRQTLIGMRIVVGYWREMNQFSRFAVLVSILLLFAALAVAIDIGGAGPAAAVTQLLSLRTTEDFRRFTESWGTWAALGSITLMVLHSVLPFPAEM